MPHDDLTPAALIPTLEPHLQRPRWWIAYSGGLDSHVLLHAIAALRAQIELPPLTALHINHRINPHAAAWAAHCESVCASLEIDCVVESVTVDPAGIGLEAAARAARYDAFSRHIGTGELLLQAHHLDDQVETLLLRLLRGSGVAGLAAMPPRRTLGAGELLRPLLGCSRAQLHDYATRHALQWIHDDSNDDPALDRNFLRLRVLPLLAQRWPAYRQTLGRAIDNAAQASALLREIAAADRLDAIAADEGLRVDRYLALDDAHRFGLLNDWLEGQRLPLPSRSQRAQVLAMCAARTDAEPCVAWPGALIHRFRGHLYAMRSLPPVPADLDIEWQPARPLRLDGLGELCAIDAAGGLRADRSYRVRNRRGGERCRPQGRAHSQTLKKLFQEYAVPPWLRDRLPLIYCGTELAAVGDVFICEGFAADQGTRGWRLEWKIADEQE